MRLDTESLRAFRAVAVTGSFTAAAGQLHLTQSAVSWKIKRLEERLGATVFRRSGRELELTDVGIELLEHADRIIEAHDEAVDRLQQSQLEGTIHLGANDELDALDLASVVARFRRRHPRVRLHVRIGLSTELAGEIQAGDLDLGLLATTEPEPNDTVVWTERLVWLCGPNPSEFDEPVPLVTFGRRCLYRPLMEAALQAVGRSSYVAFEAPSSTAVAEAIAAGMGVGVLNERGPIDGLVPWSPPGLETTMPSASFVIRTNRRMRSPVVRALVEEFLHDLDRVDRLDPAER